MKTLQPNTAVLISDKNPDEFLIKALQVVSSGQEPPFFNYDGVIVKMLRQGENIGRCKGKLVLVVALKLVQLVRSLYSDGVF